MFEINYSQLIQYEILEKLVTYMLTTLKWISPFSHLKIYEAVIIIFNYCNSANSDSKVATLIPVKF